MIRLALLALLLGALATPACGQDPAAAPEEAARAPAHSEGEFLRFVDLGQGRARLETSVVRLRDERGRTVDLVAAVHVADAEYYDLLNRVFRGYDAVLYEGISPKDQRPTPGRGDSTLSAFQRFLSDGLELEFQLDGIDYAPENFVHADLTPGEFERKMEERGESLFVLLFRASFAEAQRAAAAGGSQQEQTLGLFAALLAKDRANALKYALGRQFADLERIAAGFEQGSGEEGSVLVAERNRAALRALEERLAEGDAKLAIFYGAAHMPDFVERLAALGFRPEGDSTWLTAWDIRPRS